MTDEGTIAGCGCFIWIAVIAFNVTIGAMAVNYLIATWLHTDISTVGDVVIGLFTGELAVPAAIVTWLLRYFGAI